MIKQLQKPKQQGIYKLLSFYPLFAFFLITGPIRVNGQTTAANPDTIAAKKKAIYIINQKFNDAYLDNTRYSTFGNEYGGPQPKKLTGDLAGNFVIYMSPKSRFAYIFNSTIVLRLYDLPGDPVKAPSYMPGSTVYYRVNSNPDKPSFISVAFTHHSNGIRGQTLNPNGTFNVDSGKFSTNFFSFNFTHGNRAERGDLIRTSYETIGTDLHGPLVGLNYAHGLKEHYGFVRLNGSYSYNLAKAYPDVIDPSIKKFHNWMRLQLDMMYIMDTYNNYSFTDVKKRLNISALYYYQFPFMPNASLMAGGGYRGQDQYNILFQDSYAFFTIGIATNLSFGFRKN
jgi:hypothetical protein